MVTPRTVSRFRTMAEVERRKDEEAHRRMGALCLLLPVVALLLALYSYACTLDAQDAHALTVDGVVVYGRGER